MGKYVLIRKPYTVKGKVNPNEIGRFLEKIPDEKRNPEELLKIKSGNPILKHLEWDDKKAAHSYRLNQVRSIVSSIGIKTASGNVPSFVSISVSSADSGRSYYSVESIKNSPELIELVLKSVLDEALYFRDKHERYRAYFSDLFVAIDETEKAWRNKNGKEKKRSGGKQKANRSARAKARNRKDNSSRYVASNG